MKAFWLALVYGVVVLQLHLSVGKTLPRKGVFYSYEPIEDTPDLRENEWDSNEEVAVRNLDSVGPTDEETEQLDDADNEDAFLRFDRVWRDQFQERSRPAVRDQTRKNSVDDPYFDCRLDSSRLGDGVEGIARVEGLRDPCDSEFKILPHDISCGCYTTCFNGYRQVLGCSDGYLFDRESLSCRLSSEVKTCSNVGPVLIVNPKSTPQPQEPIYTAPPVYPTYPDPALTRLRCPNPYGLYPHPADCRLFINCGRRTPHVQSCGRGTVFSKRHHVCVYPNQEDCGYQYQSDYNHIIPV